MADIFGDLKTLQAREKNALEKLAAKRSRTNDFLDLELAKKTSRLTHQLGVQIGLLIARDGEVTHVILGSKSRIFLPDLGRFRLAVGRLRRLRLAVFLPDGERRLVKSIRPREVPHPEIAKDLLTDLEKLRLDAVMVIAVKDDETPGSVSLAYLRPFQSPTQWSSRKSFKNAEARFGFVYGRDFHDLSSHFNEFNHFDKFITDLESQFPETQKRAFKTVNERAILVGASTSSPAQANRSMEELRELARTAGIEVADWVIQRRRVLDPKTVLGTGKIEELVLHCLDLGADLVVFDRELTPGQLRAITNLTELRVIDRSMLILDIFSQRAKSSEGRLQVELAQLKYSLPRLTERDSGLSRLTGGIGGRGPGETKLEISRRRARDRIVDLEKRIDKIAREREGRRSLRKERGVPVIAIVGYTNVGKSTLLNVLTNSDVFVENKLFATLDPTSRRMRFPNQQEVIFVDTVGFISELPQELINAFRATLEEVGEADLLLHVVDASSAIVQQQIEVVAQTLDSLGFGDKPNILVLNKIDLISQGEAKLLVSTLQGMPLSAIERSGFAELVKEIQGNLASCFEGRDPGGFLRERRGAQL